jgi:general secretion pathway protein G
MRNKKGFIPLEIKNKEIVMNELNRSRERTASINRRRRLRFLSLTGFTFIELMLVVIILGILVGMVAPRLVGRGKQARLQAAEADIKSNIALALDLYELDNGNYPDKLEDLLTDPGESKAPNWNGPYLKRKPLDPWGKEYNYKSPGQNSPDYDLWTYGADGSEGGDDDIKNWEDESE